jgi:hypothetical protein
MFSNANGSGMILHDEADCFGRRERINKPKMCGIGGFFNLSFVLLKKGSFLPLIF